jgi:hypothetical protein
MGDSEYDGKINLRRLCSVCLINGVNGIVRPVTRTLRYGGGGGGRGKINNVLFIKNVMYHIKYYIT